VPAGPRSRRQFLALGGAVVLGGLAAACGSDDSEETGTSGSGESGGSGTSPQATGGQGSDGTATTDGFTVVQRYPSGQRLTPGEVRLAISIASSNGSLLTTGPDVLTGVIRNEQGETIDQIEAPRRGTGLDVPYWSITTTIPERGLYEFALDGATGDPTPFLIFDAAKVSIPAVGTKLPPFDTPTTDDARGVDPVCTRLDGPCPFHDVTLTEALAAGKPVVYIIGTPAHCATATCGPGLDFLMTAAEQYGDRATFVHAEVYADPEATEVAPAVTAYTLDYEPVVWITDAEGTVVRRIDIVWDADELGEMLAASLG
jgi:hypothetical protein